MERPRGRGLKEARVRVAWRSWRLAGRSLVLGAAMVGLQSGKAQAGLCRHRLRQCGGRRARRCAAAALADVDLDKNVNHGLRNVTKGVPAGGGQGRVLPEHGHRAGQAVQAFKAVHGNGQLTTISRQPVRQRGDALQFGRGDDLIADAIKAGAVGYVLKQGGTDELVRALQAVRQGAAALDPAVTRRVLAMMRQQGSNTADPFKDLTDREIDVLSLGRGEEQCRDRQDTRAK